MSPILHLLLVASSRAERARLWTTITSSGLLHSQRICAHLPRAMMMLLLMAIPLEKSNAWPRVVDAFESGPSSMACLGTGRRDGGDGGGGNVNHGSGIALILI